MVCVLGVCLSKYVTQALTLDGVPKYFLTDSATAMSWIQNIDGWGTFAGNRIKGISIFSRADQWSYVPGPFNPADWLKDPRDRWPRLESKPDEILVLSERRKGINLNVGLGVTTGIDGVKSRSFKK
ncbi:uncharacterized protein TNCV_4483291 [Trichonephila clavipes]|nr:uncharacterized protein TNCV_4483291 [Trichonephila clavipes]